MLISLVSDLLSLHGGGQIAVHIRETIDRLRVKAHLAKKDIKDAWDRALEELLREYRRGTKGPKS